MILLRSGPLTRIVPIIVTAVVGLFALRTANAFWVGVISALAGLWMLAACTAACTSTGRERTFWIGFAATGMVLLAVSFGPWSDQELRRSWPDSQAWQVGAVRALPQTQLMVRLLPLIRPRVEASMSWRNVAHQDLLTRVSISSEFDRVDGLDLLRDQAGRVAARLPLEPDEGARSRVEKARKLVTESLSMADFQTIGHLLIALVLSAIGGGLACLGLSQRPCC
jgi:hypothetical protein